MDLLFIYQALCTKGANILQTKSLVVEEAANELINMLCDMEEEEEEEAKEEEKPEGLYHDQGLILPTTLRKIV